MKGHWSVLSRHLSTIRAEPALRNRWICQSCRGRAQQRKLFSSSAALAEAKDKPYYVTTPIFYVNACESCLILALVAYGRTLSPARTN
ncbi:hypothetical protein GGR52DRAFT_550861 [Hypoxylon sp. FL1284]|nr:hypothetical protein GGR52DRAFT_550861 [Hypoxylon sp. FL1284]